MVIDLPNVLYIIEIILLGHMYDIGTIMVVSSIKNKSIEFPFHLIIVAQAQILNANQMLLLADALLTLLFLFQPQFKITI